MKRLKASVAFAVALLMLVPTSLFASSHREAPISALDRSADVTDWYAFVSYDPPDRVTMILNVDGFLEPSNGPNYFPFDPNVLYEMKIDNNRDGVEDITFQFRFKTEIRMPNVFTGFVGGIAGIPPITSLSGNGSEGLNLRQTYSVTMVKNGVPTDLTGGRTLYAVPSNVGPQTMPKYDELFRQGIYDLDKGVRVFAGTVDDPFFIDLGAARWIHGCARPRDSWIFDPRFQQWAVRRRCSLLTIQRLHGANLGDAATSWRSRSVRADCGCEEGVLCWDNVDLPLPAGALLAVRRVLERLQKRPWWFDAQRVASRGCRDGLL